jgi:vacuolar-type H+-ATPase subunit E/Vma4
MTKTIKHKSLCELQNELLQATLRLERQRISEEAEPMANTVALNTVNAAQKAIDTAIDALRRDATQGTHWKRPPMRDCIGVSD